MKAPGLTQSPIRAATVRERSHRYQAVTAGTGCFAFLRVLRLCVRNKLVTRFS